MNNVYLKSKNSEKKSILKLIYLLIPFLVYGLYKNGILLYKNNYGNLISLFRLPLLITISLLTSYIFSKYKKEKFVSYRLILNIFIGMITFPNTNIIIYLILIVLLNILYTYKKLNIATLYMVIYSIINIIISKYSYLNIYESSVKHSYSMLNILLGSGSGGISQTLLLYSIICLIYLSVKFEYKKYIPLTSFVTFYGLLFIYVLISKNFNYDLLFNNNVIFSFIFLNTITIFTPYTKGGAYLYGFILGLSTFICLFLDINLGMYMVTTLLSLFYNYFDKFIIKNSKV